MKKQQFIEKIKSLKKDVGDYVEKECLRLFSSGAIDPENYGDDFALPKIIMTIALKNCSDQYRPLYDQHSEELQNLEYF